MKKISILSALACALMFSGFSDAQAPAGQKQPAGQAAIGKNLDAVLRQMDTAAANFRTAEADFVWEQYQKVVDETDVQSGKIYFRRENSDTHMAADITQPEKKYVLFTGDRLQLYQPRIEQVTEREVGDNRAEVESFLVLGFGGRGSELRKNFDVTHAGSELIDGVWTAKLELVPKSERIRAMFSRIVLWIDPARSVSLRQQAVEPSGDYRLAHYRNIKINQKVSGDVFKLKTTGRTKVVKP